MWPGSLYWLAICAVVGAAIYALLCKLDPADDSFSDGADGDWPFMSADDVKLLHNGRGQ